MLFNQKEKYPEKPFIIPPKAEVELLPVVSIPSQPIVKIHIFLDLLEYCLDGPLVAKTAHSTGPIQDLMRLAYAGNANAQATLGTSTCQVPTDPLKGAIYYSGCGGFQDLDKAIHYWTLAVDQNDALALWSLGIHQPNSKNYELIVEKGDFIEMVRVFLKTF